MESRARVNETGRLPGDPSVELMQLIRKLQSRKATTEIVYIDPALHAEALQMIERHPGSSVIVHPDNRDSVLFCGHWIAPDQERSAA